MISQIFIFSFFYIFLRVLTSSIWISERKSYFFFFFVLSITSTRSRFNKYIQFFFFFFTFFKVTRLQCVLCIVHVTDARRNQHQQLLYNIVDAQIIKDFRDFYTAIIVIIIEIFLFFFINIRLFVFILGINCIAAAFGECSTQFLKGSDNYMKKKK